MWGTPKGLSRDELVDGDAQKLDYPGCIRPGLRIWGSPPYSRAKQSRCGNAANSLKAVFISDSNNFGQGPWISRSVKQVLRAFGLCGELCEDPLKGYSISEGDGLAYSYSVFTDYPQNCRNTRSIHLLNTAPAGVNLYCSASHVAPAGVK